MSFKKYIVALVYLLIVIISISACSKSEKNLIYELTFLEKSILEHFEFDDALSPVKAHVLESVLGLESEVVKQEVLRFGSGATSELIAILEFDTADSAKVGLMQLEDYLTDQIDAYESYAPKEVDRLNRAYLDRKGKYVVLVIGQEKNVDEKASIW